MLPVYYIPRKLMVGERTITEDELLTEAHYIVVLSEPGGGKTSLLNSFAKRLGAVAVTANVFSYVGVSTDKSPLIIDAFDELAKIDHMGINRLLANAQQARPKHLIISTRSSEWGPSSQQVFSDFFGEAPTLVRLCQFEVGEQKAIFDNHVIGEDFHHFQSEVARFNLEPLLPNPQFLKLFADAYVESGRSFPGKNAIFGLAAERLAREANPGVSFRSNSLTVTQKLSLSSEIFAKLLLAGSDGVCTSEACETRVYPLINTLFKNPQPYSEVLASRLFTPDSVVGQHRPIHKVVAEYCAANYLVTRIEDLQDPLTMSKCLPILAPNSTVRDELRGLIGWMAALGGSEVQKVAIQLDPYAVLANGDPSQLNPISRQCLIQRLKEIEITDPYFRRGDFGRRFSVTGFFTPEIIEEIRPILSAENKGQLVDLLLELLIGSGGACNLVSELQKLVLSSAESYTTRVLAAKCLSQVAERDSVADLTSLIASGVHESLVVAAELIKDTCASFSDDSVILAFLRSCTKIYPSSYDIYDRSTKSRYFVARVIVGLNITTVEWLLDELCTDLVCGCGEEQYNCSCKVGTSKVVGLLLDTYFDKTSHTYDPVRIWNWVCDLNYHYQINANQSKAVEVLQTNLALRQAIIAYVFGALKDRKIISSTKIFRFDFHSHSGLMLQQEDSKFLADLAFELDNHVLWSTCIPFHGKHGVKHPDSFRRHLRKQANAKPAFMMEWVKARLLASESQKLHGLSGKLKRKYKKSSRSHKALRERNVQYVNDNRSLIESGRHWSLLVRFSELALMQPSKIKEEFGDVSIAKNALLNCVDFITPHVPDLPGLARITCSSRSALGVKILFAACLEIMREKQSLENVETCLLKSLRAKLNVSFGEISDSERDGLRQEIDRLIFSDEGSKETFLRDYIESQLEIAECKSPDLNLIAHDDVFIALRAPLSIEWLTRFDGLSPESVALLFDIAQRYGERNALTALIQRRCAALSIKIEEDNPDETLYQQRQFWFITAFYYLEDVPEFQWNWIRNDAFNIFVFSHRTGKLRFDDTAWPSLTPVKVKAVLDAFIDHWPKVALPSNWSTDSPREEQAYRFIRDLVWHLGSAEPDAAIPVIMDLLADDRFKSMRKELNSICSAQLRNQALKNFKAPDPLSIVSFLDADTVVTVEGLRQLIMDELRIFQKVIDGGEFNSINRFYAQGKRLDEPDCSEIIAERISTRLEGKGIIVTPEHELKAKKRSDFTVAKTLSGTRKLLVVEVKGQWHRELYTAAKQQLHDRYAIHQDAERQGIYLVLWYGSDELIAGRKSGDVSSANALKMSIEAKLPQQLHGLIDIFVLDLSKPEQCSILTQLGRDA